VAACLARGHYRRSRIAAIPRLADFEILSDGKAGGRFPRCRGTAGVLEG
jgi:hypothetical protein